MNDLKLRDMLDKVYRFSPGSVDYRTVRYSAGEFRDMLVAEVDKLRPARENALRLTSAQALLMGRIWNDRSPFKGMHGNQIAAMRRSIKILIDKELIFIGRGFEYKLTTAGLTALAVYHKVGRE